MKLDAFAQLEGIGQAIVRHRPRLGEIPLDLGIVGRIEFEKRRIMRTYRMDERKRGICVAVIIWRLGAHAELEFATLFLCVHDT